MNNNEDKQNGYQYFLLERTNDRPLGFWGEFLCESAVTYWNENRPNSFRVWKTKAGKFVCEKIVRWDIERECSTLGPSSWKQELHVKVFDSYSEIVEFFGHSESAQYIYRDAKIPYSHVEEIG